MHGITFGTGQVQISYTQCRPWVLNDDDQGLLPGHLNSNKLEQSYLLEKWKCDSEK